MNLSDGTAQATGSTGTSVEDAAERIASLLTPEGDSEDGEAEEPKKAPKASEDDGDEPEAEEEESEGEEETEEPEAPPTFTVKIDGKEEEVALDELLRGYSRTQDYTRKTMELAEARKALEPEIQALRAEREQYAQLLPQLFAKLTEHANSAELEQLRHTDPGEWAARMREIERQDAAIRSEYERVTQLQTQESERERQARVRQEAEALLKAVPEFKDPGKFEEAKGYALEIGFTPEELADTDNHRAYVVLWKAMQFDRLKAKAPQVKAKADAVKTAKPGSSGGQPSKVTEITRAKQRLAKTGRTEDAAAVIERMLG